MKECYGNGHIQKKEQYFNKMRKIEEKLRRFLYYLKFFTLILVQLKVRKMTSR